MNNKYTPKKIQNNFKDSVINENQIELLEKEQDNVYNLYKYQDIKTKDRAEFFKKINLEYTGTANKNTYYYKTIYLPNLKDKNILTLNISLVLPDMPVIVQPDYSYYWDSDTKKLYIKYGVFINYAYSGTVSYKLLVSFWTIN